MALESGLIAGVAICDAWSGDRGAPAHRRHDPAQCCVFCNAAGRGPSLFTDAPSSEAYFFKPVTSIVVAHRIANGLNPQAKGCANNWSARAPPSFS
jgi:hypothetical protein